LKIKSQEEFADKLGYGDKFSTYGAHERGDNPIPPEIKEKLRSKKWGYTGPWPDEESDEGDSALRDSLTKLSGEVEVLRKNLNDYRDEVVGLRTVVHALQSLETVQAAIAAYQKKL
jgi:hypothetical protein